MAQCHTHAPGVLGTDLGQCASPTINCAALIGTPYLALFRSKHTADAECLERHVLAMVDQEPSPTTTSPGPSTLPSSGVAFSPITFAPRPTQNQSGEKE